MLSVFNTYKINCILWKIYSILYHKILTHYKEDWYNLFIELVNEWRVV